MKKLVVGIIALLFIVTMVAGLFFGGFVIGRTSNLPDWMTAALQPIFHFNDALLMPPAVDVDASGSASDDLQYLFKPFWQAWELVHKFYVDQPVDDELMMRGAIRGMLDSLGDEHTSYLDPAMFEAANAHLHGEEYEGIGAWVDITGEYLTIISPMPGSPAEKAGLKPGDKVIAIDGEDMTGLDGEAVRQRVLGPKGSLVVLTIQREGAAEPIEVKVTRGEIVVPTVTGTMLDQGIAEIQLSTFGDNTAKDLQDTIRKLMKEKPKGMILDLRYNGGGYLETAISVVSEFIKSGVVVMYEVTGDGSTEVFEAKKGGLATDIPLVVLINEGTASASEIVAGAIQDLGRGYLVGVKSYGKGSVQTYTELVNNEGAVRVTVARWLTPNKRQISKLGLTPDFLVELTEEDLQNGKDPQLEMAINVLLKKLIPPPTAVPTATTIPASIPTVAP